jgi:type III pantothenate kinase
MMLLIDIGNSRVKWAWAEGEQLGEQISLAHGGEVGKEWLELLASAGQRPRRVLVSNVAGAKMAAPVSALLRERFGVEPQFAHVTARAAGVTCAYPEPAQLGVDRWLAVIGAWHRAKGACCIVSCGTATTIDAVDANGLHLGGVIVPGLDLMEESLLKRTSDIAKAAGVGARPQTTLFAANTLAAVRSGAVFATAAVAERAATELERRAGRQPALYITGGNATRVAPCFVRAPEVVPDIVLQGLAAWAR